MSKEIIQENSFEGGPGGSSGTLNYQTPYGTPGGGNITQDPAHFSASDKTTSNFVPNTSKGSAGQLPNRPDRINPNKVKMDSQAGAADKLKSEKPLNPEQQYDPQVDKIFQKKDTPSPDEVMSALQYELSGMVKKDKAIAKQTVLKNLKQDPHYYSRLNMLNIDDEKMKVDETKQTTFDKTKAVLDEMIAAKQKAKGAVAVSPEINQIFKDLYDRRKAVRTKPE